VAKIIAGYVLVCTAMAALASGGQQKIAFLRSDDNSIWIANLDGTSARAFPVDGANPAISPDGTQLAFNTVSKTPERHIAVASLVTGKTTIFKNIPSENCYGPVWSHHGDQIAFNARAADDWVLVMVKSDGTGFRAARTPLRRTTTYYSFCWGADDASFFCQDLSYLYHFSFDGKLMKEWEIKKLTGGASMNSGSRLDLSPDNRRLAFDADIGTAEGVYVLDLEEETARPVPVARGYFAAQPQWLNDRELLCKVISEDNRKIALYRLKPDGSEQVLVMKKGWLPSVSHAP
jgi:Tol biopolymer transport system component